MASFEVTEKKEKKFVKGKSTFVPTCKSGNLRWLRIW